MMTSQTFQRAGSKFEDLWRGDSKEMKRRRLSDVSEPNPMTGCGCVERVTLTVILWFSLYYHNCLSWVLR